MTKIYVAHSGIQGPPGRGFDIPGLPVALPLVGNELLEVSQDQGAGTKNYQATVEQFATLVEGLVVPPIEMQLAAHEASIDQRVTAVELGQGSNVIGFATLAALNANLNYAAETRAWVNTGTGTGTEIGTYRKIGATGTGSWVVLPDRVTSLTASAALTAARSEGITELFDYPNQFIDHDFTRVIAAGGTHADGSGGYWKSTGVVLLPITSSDGRKGFSFAASSGTGNTFWVQTIAALGLAAGDKFSVALRLLGGTVAGSARILSRQKTAAGAEILGARQTFNIPLGVVAETAIQFAGVTVHETAASIDIFMDTSSAATLLELSDYMLAAGSVAQYRPPIQGRVTTPGQLAAAVAPDLEREKWRWTDNIFADPKLLNMTAFPFPFGGPDAPIVVKNGSRCLETPASAAATSRRSAKLDVSGFTSGRISASVVVHEKIGDSGVAGLRLRLVAYDALGTALSTWTAEGNDAADPNFYTRNIPQGDITSATTLVIAEDVPLPVGAVEIALDIRVETTVQAYIGNLTFREGADASYKDDYALRSAGTGATAYVAGEGDDASGTGSVGAPFATVNAALIALGGSGLVVLNGPEFGPEQQIDPTLVTGRVVLAGTFAAGAPTIVRMADPLTGITKTAGRTKVYQAAAGITATPNWAYQDGVHDARTAIAAGEGRPAHNGRSHRLYCTKLVAATAATLAEALTEMDSAADPRCFYDSGVLYFTADGGGDGSIAAIYLDAATGLIAAGTIESAGEILIQNLDVRYGGINTRPFRRSHLSSVQILGSRGNAWDYAGCASFEYLETSCAGSNAGVLGDGVNGHDHSNLQGVGLYSHDNRDDGESAHEWGRVRVRGAFFEFMGGAAVAPAYGCDAIYEDCESNANQQIPGRKPGAFAVVGAPTDGGSETLAIFRRCRSVGDSVSFFDASQSSAVRAVCEDCESVDPSSIAYDVATIRNCRHSGTGTVKTAKVAVENAGLVA